MLEVFEVKPPRAIVEISPDLESHFVALGLQVRDRIPPPLARVARSIKNTEMAYWLVKTEPDVYSIDDLKSDGSTAWTEVRNYQARNYLKEMKVGEDVLVYHSNSDPAGVVGIARVVKVAFADPTQFDKRSEVFDPKATPDNVRWFCPELAFVKKGSQMAALVNLREVPELQGMVLLQRGSRLSVQPVTKVQFRVISKLIGKE